MSPRPARWFVLCFAALWFGVLVPVHNRGQIAVPGSGRPCHSTAAASCHHRGPGQTPGPAPDPTPKRGSACAVCFFIAGLDTPPPVTTVEHLFGLAADGPVAEPAFPTTARIVLPFHSRAPPAV